MVRLFMRCRVRGAPSYITIRSYTARISSGVRSTVPFAAERQVAWANIATTPSRSPASSSSAYRWTSAVISSRSPMSAHRAPAHRHLGQSVDQVGVDPGERGGVGGELESLEAGQDR